MENTVLSKSNFNGSVQPSYRSQIRETPTPYIVGSSTAANGYVQHTFMDGLNTTATYLCASDISNFGT